MKRAIFFLQRHPKSGIIYYRRVLHNSQRQLFGGITEVKRSLRTRDKAVAVNRAAMVNLEVDKVLDKFFGVQQMGDDQYLSKIVIGDVVIDYGGDVEKELAAAERLKPILEAKAKASAPVPSSVPAPASHAHGFPSKKLADVCKEYRSEMMLGGSWKTKTEAEHGTSHALMLQWFGNREISTITVHDGKKFKEVLMSLPPNMTKGVYAGKTIKQIIAMKPEKTLAPKTINDNYIQRFSSLFSWAVRQGYCAVDPFAGLKVKIKPSAIEDKDPFNAVELTAIFDPSIYNLLQLKEWQYWVPLLSLYSAGRLREIAQLRTMDIVTTDGVPSINIVDEAGSVKTFSGRRMVPIHPKLIELGFLDFANWAHAEGRERLFPELHTVKINPGEKAGRWFNRTWMKKVGLLPKPEGRKISFHSFRHAFIDELKKQDVPEHKAKQITGHSHDSITYGRYGSETKMDELLRIVGLVKYSVLD